MAGNVVVDEVEREEPPHPRLPTLGMVILGTGVVLALALLPGRPDESSAPTVTGVPDVALPEDEWVATDLPGSGSLTQVARLGDGSYVAVGEGPQVWKYWPGESWEWMLDGDAEPGSFTAVTSYRAGAVAVGAQDPDGSGRQATVWMRDGEESWSRVPLEIGRPSGLEGVFADRPRIVAWGWLGSSRHFSPMSEPLVLQSTDGRSWSEVSAFREEESSSRLFTVTRIGANWLAGGYSVGRPAAWVSDAEMGSWRRLDTADLPFGSAIVDFHRTPEEEMVVTLVEMGEARSRRWMQAGEGWEPLDRIPGGLVLPAEGEGSGVGVGGGSLWSSDRGEWERLALEGEVAAASEGVAVGSGPDNQPRAWVQGGGGSEEIRVVPARDGGRWQSLRDLGEGRSLGAWKVAEGWVLGGTQDEWWFLDGEGVESFRPPWGDSISTIAPVGDEWVALPSMYWTSTGTEWERRADPWPGERAPPQVVAVTQVDGSILAVGRDGDLLWNVAVSADGGRSWSLRDDPAPATPVWDVAGTPEGFVATAPGTRGAQEVVFSRQGRTWETLAPGAVLVDTQPPTALVGEGSIVVLDSGRELEPPRTDVSAVARAGDALVLEAGRRLWREADGGWAEIPLDPPHGMSASRALPLPLADSLLALGVESGRRVLYQWQP
ncbi:MAG: hypothetical protein ACLFWM_11875 [Actinomycetota bacterium]